MANKSSDGYRGHGVHVWLISHALDIEDFARWVYSVSVSSLELTTPNVLTLLVSRLSETALKSFRTTPEMECLSEVLFGAPSFTETFGFYSVTSRFISSRTFTDLLKWLLRVSGPLYVGNCAVFSMRVRS